MKTKRAIITGITGQDGSYLAELLISKAYEVHGVMRRSSTTSTARIEHIYVDPHTPGAQLFLHYGDLSDSSYLTNLIYEIKPDEIYNLGAQSHVKVSFDLPEYTGDITGLGAIRILEAIKKSGLKCKFYQASSSEMFGSASPPQNEDTVFCPRSPYATAKVYAYWMTKVYRDAYNLFAVNGILFNHESPRRGETFVTRKITIGVVNILKKKQDFLYMGNINSKRDWGYAPEYVEAMWMMLQQDKPDDYVIGTGEWHSVKEFLEEAFSYVGLNWQDYVKIDKNYLRPIDVENLRADYSKAKSKLGWEPKVTFKDLVRIMMDAEMRTNGLTPPGEGDKTLKKKFPEKWWTHD